MLRVTKTETGMVRGLPGTDARITVFKGIPFAADTSGNNRWRAPQPAESWEGVRNCFEFSPITMQSIPGKDPNAFYSKEWHVDPEVPMGEDSLTVNIWTPAKTGDEKMPVYVWIFGGGLKEGYSYEMEFDGERMASRGIVVVSIAYRVNIFGFLAHPDLTAEAPDAPTNFGFLDQKAGIEWVKRNIANFGGDPDNITIGGQSAGGVSVFKHLCAPSEKGLFQRAIIQSSAGGSMRPPYPINTHGAYDLTLEETEAFGKKFLEEVLGVSTIEEARKLDAFYIRDKVDEARVMFRATLDNKYLSKSVGRTLYDGELHDMPIMLGYTGGEVPFYAQGNTMEELKAWAAEKYGEHADKMIELWKGIAGSDDVEAIKKASHSNSNEVSNYSIADEYARQGRDCYCYIFDPEMPGDNAGTFHSSDLWFTFETLMKCWRPFDGHHYDLARKMCNYWVNFIKTGNPNGNDADGTPMPQWDAYTTETPNVMQFCDEISLKTTPLNPAKQYLIDLNTEYFKNHG